MNFNRGGWFNRSGYSTIPSFPRTWIDMNNTRTVPFDQGTATFVVGNTVTGGTSGATGIVRSFVLTSGDWSTSDAAGYVYLYDVKGTFQDNEVLS